MAMIMAKLHFFMNIQSNRHRMFTRRMAGKAIPINEKKAVLRGDTYHAGKDRRSKNMDIILITRNSDFVIFLTIIMCLFLFFTSIK